jgi:hypothetical protein
MEDGNDGDDGADFGGNGDGSAPAPFPEVEVRPSDDTDLNDRSSGVVTQDPLGVSGQGFADSYYGGPLGGPQLALGEAAAALADSLNQNANYTSALFAGASQPYSLLNDLKKVSTGEDSPPTVAEALRSFASDSAWGLAITLFGGVAGVLTAPVAIPLELADMGVLSLTGVLSVAGAFARGTAVAGTVQTVFEWGDFLRELPQKTIVRAVALVDIYDNTRPSVFDLPTPSQGSTSFLSQMNDMSVPNSFFLK